MKKFIKAIRNSRGFGIAEAVVALSIITIVSMATMTLFMSSVKSASRARDKAEAQNIAEAIIDCYRITDNADDFGVAVEFVISNGTQNEKEEDRPLVECEWSDNVINLKVTVNDQTVESTYNKYAADENNGDTNADSDGGAEQ